MTGTKSPTILYIFDELPEEELLSRLKNDNYRTIKAKGQAEAIQAIGVKKPDIILVETASLKFAIDVIGDVKKVKKFARIPVIVVSSENEPQEKVALFSAGANDYVNKPYEYSELQARIDSHLRTYFLNEELVAENQVLREIAVVDEVTGLFNKRYLMGRITGEVSRAVRQGETISFVIIHIDDIDGIVSVHSEDTKDFLLKQIAFSLKEMVRLSDIVIRYGDDELAVLCPITDHTGLELFVERVRQKIERTTFEHEGTPIRTTVSMGAYTLVTSDFNSLEKKINNIINFAEEALDRAKENHGNRVVFFE